MDYSCPKCSRVFSCAEAIFFCPFCGTAYASAPGASAVSTTRIVIGSDSRARCAGKILEFDACRNQPGSLRAGGQAAQPRRIHLAPAERARMAYFSIQTQQHGAVQGRMRRFSGRNHAGFSVGPFRRAGRPAHRHRSNGQSHGRYLPAAAKRHPAEGRFTAASPACVPADKHRRQAG